MLLAILLWWIGMQLQAPTWYFVIVGVGFFVKILFYGIDMYKKGKDAK